jgi:hypothetical protein
MDGPEPRAGVEIHGRALRYAEVSGRGAATELVRLGACDFDFDVAEALLGPASPPHLDTVATAVREIFAESAAESLAVVLHPWDCTSFFSPLPAGMPPSERFEQLRQEAAMLSDSTVARPLRVKATPVRVEDLGDGRAAHWHHVLRLPDSVHARIDHVVKWRGEAEREAQRAWPHDFAGTVAAAAAVVGRRPEMDEEGDPFALAVGVYGARCEVAVCRGTTWYFGHHTETAALEGAGLFGDGAYFVAALLDRLGVEALSVEHLYLYGEDADSASIEGVEDLLGLQARPLNPLEAFRPARSGADPLSLASYAPVIGALLR